MLCGLQLFVGTIARSLMPWWLVLHVGDIYSHVGIHNGVQNDSDSLSLLVEALHKCGD